MTTELAMAIELKPCPFCQGSASIERFGDRRQSTIYSCDWCGCTLETGEEWGYGDQWNQRTFPDAKDLTPLLKIAHAAKGEGDGVWFGGHLMDDDHPCNCLSIFDGGHAGGIATVTVDNGLSISEGGNDGPSKELAGAIQKYISTMDPAKTMELIEEISFLRARVAELVNDRDN